DHYDVGAAQRALGRQAVLGDALNLVGRPVDLDRKNAAAADRRADRHRVTQQLTETLDDRQAEPQALRALAGKLVVLVENPLLLAARNTDSGIDDLQPHPPAARPAAAHENLAAFGIANRIGQQI